MTEACQASFSLGGGTTTEYPCGGMFGGYGPEWCTWADYLRVRDVYRAERNALIELVDWWTHHAGQTVNGKMVEWDDLVTTPAYDLTKTSYDYLLEHTADIWTESEKAVDAATISLHPIILDFAKRAAMLRAARCDMADKILALGVEVPAVAPLPPTPEGLTDKLAAAAENVAKSIGWGLVGVGALVGGVILLRSFMENRRG